MTKEEAKLVLDSLATWEGEERMITAEHVKAIKVLSQEPCLLNDLEEAAKKYAETSFTRPYSDTPEDVITIIEPEKCAGFIAGAKWQKEQMLKEAVEEKVDRTPLNGPVGVTIYCSNFPPSHPFYKCKPRDKVQIIVLPKE